jgi:transglutaminase-like putative cysteine protease
MLAKSRRFHAIFIAIAVLHINVSLFAQTAPRERKFAFEYAVTVKDIPTGTKRLDLWIPVPHDDPYQKITELQFDAPYQFEIRRAEYGNRMAHIRLENPKQTNFTVTMRFVVLRREHLRVPPLSSNATMVGSTKDENDPNVRRWLQSDRLVPLDDKIRGWAQDVVNAANAKTDLEKARAIYNHIVATVKYDKTGQGWGRGDIYYACDARRGNCTDFHAIFIGYCRALGIPARFSIGFSIPKERGEGEIAGYHCWAEFYIESIGWIPVDASEAAKDPTKREYFFGAHDENRVEFTRGRDLILSPRQQGEPLNYFVYPYTEVDGKPFAGIERSFKYRDIK